MAVDIAEIARAAEVMGLRGEALNRFILDSGGSIDAYQQYMQRNTIKVIAIILALAGAMVGAVVWWRWDQLLELLKG